MNKKIAYIWISKLNISYKEKIRLINELGGICDLFSASLDELVELNVKDKYIFKILDINVKKNCYKDFEYLLKNDIDIIGIEDKEYPVKLKNIFEKPICFYIRGNKTIFNNTSVGIIGSRLAEKESLLVSRNIVKLILCVRNSVYDSWNSFNDI